MSSTATQSRGRVLASLTVIRKFIGTVTDKTTCSEIEVRLAKLEGLWSEFQNYEDQVAIMATNNPSLGLELKQEEFENSFFETKSCLLDLLQKKQPKVPTPAPSTSSFDLLLDQQRAILGSLADRTQAINDRSMTQSFDNHKLPQVHIDKFTGEYEAWPSFYDLYTSSVHNVDTISNVHKFQILTGLLRGSPLNIIRNFLVTDANYLEAWNKLVKRYNKKRPTLNSHIERFFDQPAALNGSSQLLRQLSDTSDEIIRGIKALGKEAELRDHWLIRILLTKVDEETRVAWANETIDQEFPTFDDFLEFLNNRCYAKESALGETKKKGIKSSSGTLKSMFSSASNIKCPCCKRSHYLWKCISFKRMSIEKRRELVNQSNVCYNCLREGHAVNKCPVDYSCRICKGRHSTLLHLGPETDSSEQSLVSSVIRTEATAQPVDLELNLPQNSSTVATAFNISNSRLALLPTAVVYVRDSAGNHHMARALLDSGSQSTFINESLVQRLNLPRSYTNVRVSGISETKAETSKGVVNLTIQSRIKASDRYEVEALILTKLTSSIPQVRINAQWIDEMNNKNLQLADPAYYTPNKIDILLGADIFFEVLIADKFTIKDRLIAQSTKFGWVISGASYEGTGKTQSFSATIEDENIPRLLERFWTLEEIPTTSSKTEAEQKCERHFIETHSRNVEGRYVVRLPFKNDSSELGHSKSAAINRLMAMERKFQRYPNLQTQYVNFMTEYVKLGHMHEMKPTEITCPPSKCFYLPHHGVIKQDSSTTKLRVVFDGSCKSSSGVSLNNKLLVGPTIQKDLVSILLMFRKYAIVFTSDEETMYRQIHVDKLDQNYQRIVWRTSADEPIKTFQLNTVTYGTSCAPFLAVRTLHQIAENYKSSYQIGARIAQNDFYVDDCLSGANSINEAKLAVQEVSALLVKAGCFNLRKWKSNSPELLSIIPPESREKTNLHIDDRSATVKTLGLQWNPTKDTFSYKINLEQTPVHSKREMLSQIARIFDPLGWISPATIILKISLQKLWLRKLNWDDPLPADIVHQWKKNKSSMHVLEDIEVPRFLMTTDSTTNIQIHGFSDSSEHAYAAVTYLRTTNSHGIIHTRIIMSKTKVAPLKQVSLPRLELCGSVLLSRLIKYTKRALELEDVDLSWLADVPRRWKCFIGNRTSEILENGPQVHWNYVTSKENPADIAFRGVHPKQLLECTEWWSGPKWLIKSKEEWPTQQVIERTNIEERQNSVMSHLNTKSNNVLDDLFTRVESYSKIKRILALVLRWKLSFRKWDIIDLLEKAETMCVKWAQSEEFQEDIRCLNQNRKIGSTSKLISLTPFIDVEGILRVGGRLTTLNASFNIRHPILLPGNHILSERVIKQTHIQYLHPGPTLLTSILRQKYWIINCRNKVRIHINKCTECRRQRAVTSQQLMGSLPTQRITPSRSFLHTGVDYAGPLYFKSRYGRGRIPMVKGYICVFICFATKALHIELCLDMTAEAFIAALRRFTSRRGIPLEIRSDNGTNFIGAKRKLDELSHLYKLNHKNTLISEFISQNKIKFIVNPASAPHFGGLWESSIKSIKHHLNRVTRNTTMTPDEMQTLLVQIEGILNSRPLCPMSNNIDDLYALTPAHFLIGEAITSVPEPSLEHVTMNRLSRWQNVQARMQGFWTQWRINYLHTLQQRQKWTTKSKNVKPGNLVVVKEDNIPPSKWLLGRIITCHSGKDGLVRVATIKTASGILKRPIVKLCQLMSNDETVSLVSQFNVLQAGAFNSPGVCSDSSGKRFGFGV